MIHDIEKINKSIKNQLKLFTEALENGDLEIARNTLTIISKLVDRLDEKE